MLKHSVSDRMLYLFANFFSLANIGFLRDRCLCFRSKTRKDS